MLSPIFDCYPYLIALNLGNGKGILAIKAGFQGLTRLRFESYNAIGSYR